MESKRTAELTEKRQFWQARLEEWKASDITQAEYCRLHNLDARNFQYWKKRLLQKTDVASLVELPAKLLLSPGAAGSAISLVIDGRFRVEVSRGFDSDTLGRLIKVLSRP
jgi:hypothetical protein